MGGFFTRKAKGAYKVGNVYIRPISSVAFTESLATGNGLLTAGGFEGPAEAIFLGKKVFSIPMSNQYEQLCNWRSLKKTGCYFSPSIKQWNNEKVVGLDSFCPSAKN